MTHIANTSTTTVINRIAFAVAMEKAARFVERRTAIPILTYVHVKGGPDHLTITATNLDQETVTHVPATGADGIDLTLPAYKTRDMLKKIKTADTVTLVHRPNAPGGPAAVLGFDGLEITLQSRPAEDFPVREFGETFIQFDLPTSDLLDALTITQRSISTEETRYYLCGVYVHAVDGKLRFVSTDGHRMNLFDLDCPAGAGGMTNGYIIPALAVTEMIWTLKRKDAPATVTVQIDAAGSHIRFLIGDNRITSKFIDGTFPDYTRVVPQEFSCRVEIDRDVLLEGLAGVRLISDNKNRSVLISVAQNATTLTVRDPDSGEAATTVRSVCVSDESYPIEVGFNGGYFATVLAACKPGVVTLNVGRNFGPALIQGADPHWRSVLMPVRV